MTRTFRFITQDDKVMMGLNRTFRSSYRVNYFEFNVVTPKGHILNYKWNNKTNYVVTNGMTVKETLSQIVLRLSPPWYGKYIDVFPIKVIDLKVYPA